VRTTQERNTFRDTEWRNHPTYSEQRIRTRYGFHYLRGNRRPYFSITADIAERCSVHNRHEDDGEPGYKIVGGGCCHDDIEQAFPELRALIRWHLVGDDGEPMHYVANAVYWMQKHLGVFRLFGNLEPEGRPRGETEPLKAFKSTIVYGVVASDPVGLSECLSGLTNGAERVIDLVKIWLGDRSHFLRLRMERDMRRHNVEYIITT